MKKLTYIVQKPKQYTPEQWANMSELQRETTCIVLSPGSIDIPDKIDEDAFYHLIKMAIGHYGASHFLPSIEDMASDLGLTLDYKKLSQALLTGIRLADHTRLERELAAQIVSLQTGTSQKTL